MLRALLRRGVQANAQDNGVNIICVESRVCVVLMSVVCVVQGCTALHYAAFWGREECATILLDAGADKTILSTVFK